MKLYTTSNRTHTVLTKKLDSNRTRYISYETYPDWTGETLYVYSAYIIKKDGSYKVSKVTSADRAELHALAVAI